MDGQRFDDLTQYVTSLLNRRRFGGALAVLGLGGSLGVAPKTKAKKKKKKKCKSGTVKCGQKCVNTSNDSAHCGSCTTACGTGQSCVGGTCTPAVGCNPKRAGLVDFAS